MAKVKVELPAHIERMIKQPGEYLDLTAEKQEPQASLLSPRLLRGE